MTRKSRRLLIFFGVFALLLAFDQVTKAMARTELAHGPKVLMNGTVGVTLHLGLNPGMAFSLLQQPIGRVILTVIGLAVCVGIGALVIRARAAKALVLIGLGLVGAGAVGNLADRVRVGVVTDFLAVRVGSFWWPTFNVADAALVAGVVVLALCRERWWAAPAAS